MNIRTYGIFLFDSDNYMVRIRTYGIFLFDSDNYMVRIRTYGIFLDRPEFLGANILLEPESKLKLVDRYICTFLIPHHSSNNILAHRSCSCHASYTYCTFKNFGRHSVLRILMVNILRLEIPYIIIDYMVVVGLTFEKTFHRTYVRTS